MEALCCLHLGADTRDSLYNLVYLGGNGTDKCYELIMAQCDGALHAFHFLVILLLSGYWPTEKSDFLLDALAEGFEFEKEDEDFEVLLRIFYKDISLEDNLSFGYLNDTIINNINGLPPLVKGETHSEGGPMEKLLTRFPCKRIICSTCNASKLSWRFSKDYCYDCIRRDFSFCSLCRVWKGKSHFTSFPRTLETPFECTQCGEMWRSRSSIYEDLEEANTSLVWFERKKWITSMPKGGKQRLCYTCNTFKSYTSFSQYQLRNVRAPCCKECRNKVKSRNQP